MRQAAGKLADPTDVVLIDMTSLTDPDDIEAIDAAIAELLEAKPHLAATGTPPPSKTHEQGPRGTVPVGSKTQGEQAENWLRTQFGRG